MFGNPIDLSYRYQHLQVRGYPDMVWREGADPSLIRFRDRYLLWLSMSGGFWHSDDLASWTFVATPDLPIDDYAPDACEIDGALVVTASNRKRPCSFWRSEDPLSGRFTEIPGSFPFWDPCLFQDDDGRVYLYWGCELDGPISGIELDRVTLQPIGDAISLIRGDHVRHGWERNVVSEPDAVQPGDLRPWIEGAWMTKHDGRYHLQYAAPATESSAYADGSYVADGPLGPFTYEPSSPFSSVPGGFAPGAGHGSTMQDRYGNWWHAATIRISRAHSYERRVGIYPAGFDETGALFCDQRFADHPIVVPQRLADPRTDTDPGWRLLSRHRPVSATSSSPGVAPEAVVDEDIRTTWVAGTVGTAEGVTVDLGEGCTVCAVQVDLADHGLGARKLRPPLDADVFSVRTIDVTDHPVPCRVEASVDGTAWSTLAREDGRDSPHRLVVTDRPIEARFVRVTGGPGAWDSPFALRGVRVFGVRVGDPPGEAVVTAVWIDDCTARVTWRADDSGEGVNVRYGNGPERLHHSWRVHDRTELVLSTLSSGVDYWVAVDRFNGSGVTTGAPVHVVNR